MLGKKNSQISHFYNVRYSNSEYEYFDNFTGHLEN
jgi:hypothetical protein